MSPVRRARRSLEVLAPGPLACVQDLGRPGYAALGVGRSGAADRPSLRLANRLVGNPESAAAVEVTLGGLAVRLHGGMWAALTGAPCPAALEDGRGSRVVPPYSVCWVPDGAVLRLGTPPSGLRSYLALRGGVTGADVVLGSRSTDTLAGLGPAPLAAGDRLEVGDAPGEPLRVDHAPVRPPADGVVRLRVSPGPRADWFAERAHAVLVSETFEVTADSNRVGMRLAGRVLERREQRRHDELPSEGMVPGALQVPPTGLPTLFLADHPVTGGYPVIAVVLEADVALAAQARPGQALRFVPA